MRVLSTKDVLAAEFEELWGPDTPSDDVGAACFSRGQAALCLSGGGCRSSTFALGIVQGLAAHGLLTRFHYLSTVSGGGFLGSMLSRWALSLARAGHPADAATRVQKELGDFASPSAPLAHLRQFSNYLTPRRGLASGDTWTALALWTRNTLINWMLFLPALMCVAVISYIYSFIVACVLPPGRELHLGLVPPETALLSSGVLAAAALLLSVATCRASLLLPSHTTDPSRRLDRRAVALQVVTPALGSAFLLPIGAAPWTGVCGAGAFLDMGVWYIGAAQLAALVGGYVAACIILAVQRQPIDSFIYNFGWWFLSSAASTAVLLLAAFGLAAEVDTTWHNAVLATLGPLVVVIAQLTASTVYVGLRQLPPPRKVKRQALAADLDREWLARLSAMKVRPALAWAAVAACVLLLQRLAFSSSATPQTMTLTSAFGVVSGVVAVLGGKSNISSMVGRLRLPRQRLMAMLISVGTVVVIAVILMLLFRLHLAISNRLYPLVLWLLPQSGLWISLLFQAALLCAYLVLVLMFSRLVNVNRFSLGGVYRNRLARAYLGAGNLEHEPEPFTGFDSRDNVRVHQLETRAGGRRVLFHVLNLALNVAKTKNLAWQERMALPFTVSPLHCGSAELDVGGNPGAYIPSNQYGGSERELGMDNGGGLGISLATAMTISGAAASPNMGYHTAPATAFLMTLFNVRLGAWLPNPRLGGRMTMQASGPKNSLMPFLRELAGQTNDHAADVYLSDGGHFENLGLYEMVRRRCRYILVSDAGCDEAFAFEDLGNAMRKVALDFPGVEIVVEKLDRLRARAGADPAMACYAFGRIRYPGIEEEGVLLYVKPTWLPGLPTDIQAYGLQNAAFPHEPTSDQWFSESQFESYRHLGETLMRGLIEGDDPAAKAFFDALRAGQSPCAKS